VSAEAKRLVECAYGALDLFAGRREELAVWVRELSVERLAADAAPPGWAPVTAAALRDELTEAGVLDAIGAADPYRLAEFQRVVELLTPFQDAEMARRPAPKPRVVFTLPDGVVLPDRARDLTRRTLAVRVLSALGSATDRTLLASPFWSDAGTGILWDGLARSVDLDIPITLAGAREHDTDPDFLAPMLRLAGRLRDAGAREVRALRYVPPGHRGLFHGKVVCGQIGYLGSANLTGSGLGEHVEAGIPLDPVDVDHVWWLLDVLIDAGLLVPIAF
jgi:hypothetical protein